MASTKPQCTRPRSRLNNTENRW